MKPCYEDCLRDYQREAELQCGDEWIAIKDCQLDLGCEDLFGDCESTEDDFNECVRIANNRAFCEMTCPSLDITQCQQDTTECRELAQADNYCETNCPTQDREDCIEQYLSTGRCGSAGAGGTGGSGGQGGSEPAPACDAGPLTSTDRTMIGEGALACVATLPFDLTIKLAATPKAAIAQGANEFDLQVEVTIDAATVNTVVDLADEVTINLSISTVNATAGDSDPTPFDVVDTAVPCTLAFVRDQDAVMVTTIIANSWTLDDGGTLTLTLEAVTLLLEALGLPVELTTEGAEASCQFVGDMPSVSFSLPQ
ncbi:MAG: hypothetical protein JRJ80_13765 [Deltaproteobacteria bacterium]|nr:hypothetical protein [Deltaproteobacteria bacterium]